MSGNDSVAHWLGALKGTRRGEIDGQRDGVLRRLVRLAATRLPSPAPQATDADEFWRVLVSAAVRGGMAGGHEPELTREVVARLADECDRLLDALSDEHLRRIALLRLAGRFPAEIASEMGISSCAVDRKLALIRALWEQAP